MTSQKAELAGVMLDDLGVTCEMLARRFDRTGNFSAQRAVWDALSEFQSSYEKINSQVPEEFGAEA